MKARAGLVLAGGLSSRMGENKALLPFGPKRLVDHVAERLGAQCAHVAVSTNTPLTLDPPLPCLGDDIPGFAGPLAGIAAGLAHVRATDPQASHMLSVAADTPFFPANLAAALTEAAREPDQVSVAASEDGSWHPVFALWPVAMEDDLRLFLTDPDNRRLKAFIRRHPHRVVTFPLLSAGEAAIDPFFNVNTPEDYQRALALRDQIA